MVSFADKCFNLFGGGKDVHDGACLSINWHYHEETLGDALLIRQKFLILLLEDIDKCFEIYFAWDDHLIKLVFAVMLNVIFHEHLEFDIRIGVCLVKAIIF